MAPHLPKLGTLRLAWRVLLNTSHDYAGHYVWSYSRGRLQALFPDSSTRAQVLPAFYDLLTDKRAGLLLGDVAARTIAEETLLTAHAAGISASRVSCTSVTVLPNVNWHHARSPRK